MPSTYTSRLRLEKQAVGENDNTWGTLLNTVIDLVDEGMDGYLEVNCAGASDVTLTALSSSSDQSRQRVLKLTGALTGAINVIVPAVEKHYIVWNMTTGSFGVTLKPSGGTGISLTQNHIFPVFTDGATMYQHGPSFDPSTQRLDITLVDDGADNGPELFLRRTSSSPAIGDTLGSVQALGRTDSDASVLYAGWLACIMDPANATGSGCFRVRTRLNGSTVTATSIEGDCLGILHDIKTFTTSGSWTKPTDLKTALVIVQAAGGGGGGVAATSAGEGAAASGGGAGEYRMAELATSALSSSVTVTIGAVGSAGTAGPNNGGDAADSSFGAHVICDGGHGGIGAAASSSNPGTAGGIGGTGGTGGFLAVTGQAGGGTKLVGGVFIPTGDGGDAQLGRGARAPINAAGAAGGAYGGGGSGATAGSSESAKAGGAGGAGIVIVYEYK